MPIKIITTLRLACLVSFLLLLNGCILPEVTARGPGTINFTQPTTINLSASAINGTTPYSYQWTIVDKPAGSQSALESPQSLSTKFLVDVSGRYTFKFEATDANGLKASNVEVVDAKVSIRPKLNLSTTNRFNKYIERYDYQVGESIVFDASKTPAADLLNFKWTLLSKPSTSNLKLVYSFRDNVSFKADVAGEYKFSLKVSNNTGDDETIEIQVEAFDGVKALDYLVVDAEYSRALDKLISVSEAPHQLRIYDPVTFAETKVALSKAPTSVSLSPNGLYAAVSHDQLISYIDLQQAKLAKEQIFPTFAFDVALAANQFAYVSSHEGPVYTVDLQTNATSSAEFHVAGEIKLHPSERRLYGTKYYGINIVRYDIIDNVATRYGPGQGESLASTCGNLWFSHDGSRLFTACGTVIASSEDGEQDLQTELGALSWGTFDLDISEAKGQIASIESYELVESYDLKSRLGKIRDNGEQKRISLEVFDYASLAKLSEYTLPNLSFSDSDGIITPYRNHGQFVFYNTAANKLFAILRLAEEREGPANKSIIVSLENKN